MQFGTALLALLPQPLEVSVGASSGELADPAKYTVCAAVTEFADVASAEETQVVTSWLEIEASALLCRPLEPGELLLLAALLLAALLLRCSVIRISVPCSGCLPLLCISLSVQQTPRCSVTMLL